MKILRGFQVINKDGGYSVSSTYNEVNEQGETVKPNAKDSFFVVDETVKSHIDAVEAYIRQSRFGQGEQSEQNGRE